MPWFAPHNIIIFYQSVHSLLTYGCENYTTTEFTKQKSVNKNSCGDIHARLRKKG